MSSILDILGGNSDLESEEEETMVDSKQIVEHEIKKDLSESPVSDSKERKLERCVIGCDICADSVWFYFSYNLAFLSVLPSSQIIRMR